MGCPAPKIVNNNSGSALMKNPKLCGNIVKLIKNSVKCPITIKIRKGINKNLINAVEISKICEYEGADAIIIHGRTKEQMYAPFADWNIIKDIKNSVSIPVIGNGDIDSPIKAKKLIEFSGCDFIMIGRASLGYPWIFNEINNYFKTGKLLSGPSFVEKIRIIKKHVNLVCKYKGEKTGILECRKLISWYLKGLPGASNLRNEVFKIKSLDEFDIFINTKLNQI